MEGDGNEQNFVEHAGREVASGDVGQFVSDCCCEEFLRCLAPELVGDDHRWFENTESYRALNMCGPEECCFRDAECFGAVCPGRCERRGRSFAFRLPQH